jgi:hypothetical protein
VLIWSFVSQFQVEEGAAAVAVIMLLAVVIDSSGFGLFESRILSSHLKFPLSGFFALMGVLGALSFSVLGLCGMKRVCNVIDASRVNVIHYPLGLMGLVGGAAFGPGGRLGYGTLSLFTWLAALLFLSIAVGVKRAGKFFALPSLLFLATAVLLFDPRQMSAQAVNIASHITFDRISLLSNWFLLTVSLSLMAFLAFRSSGAYRRVRAASLTRQARDPSRQER